ncbi:hypothetical protein J5N97_019805 [Dioscorea zingiberensis]|uniref:Uncharacterized protein n=1 Tax=Dioscorea zingiberensis TaxID=325984 RepID=A0A9D5CEP2_9LILI|nr:hypothetical protein J5N97_019805 [Dioscorea zingiberensis]
MLIKVFPLTILHNVNLLFSAATPNLGLLPISLISRASGSSLLVAVQEEWLAATICQLLQAISFPSLASENFI